MDCHNQCDVDASMPSFSSLRTTAEPNVTKTAAAHHHHQHQSAESCSFVYPSSAMPACPFPARPMQQSLDGAHAAAAGSSSSGGLATSYTMGRMTNDRGKCVCVCTCEWGVANADHYATAAEAAAAVSKVIATKTPVRLDYTIHEYSSYCGTFHPHNIRVNKPSDQSSRWSSGTHDQTQYLVLRLDQPAVACKSTQRKNSPNRLGNIDSRFHHVWQVSSR